MPGIESPGRLQLALNVRNLDEAVTFYRDLFGAEPHKVRPGYANFAIDNPPLKLVLFERPELDTAEHALNHLGVEVFTTDEVVRQARRLSAGGLPVLTQDGIDCCHARQDKLWVHAPDGLPWEVYTVTDDYLDAEPAAAAKIECCVGGACC